MQTQCACFFSFFRLSVQGLYSVTVISGLALMTFSLSQLWMRCRRQKSQISPLKRHLQQMARKTWSSTCLSSVLQTRSPELFRTRMTPAFPHVSLAEFGRPHQPDSSFWQWYMWLHIVWLPAKSCCSKAAWGSLSSRLVPLQFSPRLICQSIALPAAKSSLMHSNRYQKPPLGRGSFSCFHTVPNLTLLPSALHVLSPLCSVTQNSIKPAADVWGEHFAAQALHYCIPHKHRAGT